MKDNAFELLKNISGASKFLKKYFNIYEATQKSYFRDYFDVFDDDEMAVPSCDNGEDKNEKAENNITWDDIVNGVSK